MSLIFFSRINEFEFELSLHSKTTTKMMMMMMTSHSSPHHAECDMNYVSSMNAAK